jgi:catecholate siderophore receptor
VSLWTTYNLSTLVNTGPGKLTVGGGVFYRDRVFADNGNLNLIPSSFTFDGMLSYEWQKYRVALNMYNLTDELNYNTFNAGRAIPSAGRTFTVSGSVRW